MQLFTTSFVTPTIFVKVLKENIRLREAHVNLNTFGGVAVIATRFERLFEPTTLLVSTQSPLSLSVLNWILAIVVCAIQSHRVHVLGCTLFLRDSLRFVRDVPFSCVVPEKSKEWSNFDEADENEMLMDDDKRAPHIFRYGRAPVFRYGKRAPSIFRYGKKATVFRYGKRSPSIDDAEDNDMAFLVPVGESSEKRKVFRYGK